MSAFSVCRCAELSEYRCTAFAEDECTASQVFDAGLDLKNMQGDKLGELVDIFQRLGDTGLT